MDPAGNFYLYVYPIISSIFAGIIFWFIFSYIPERKRRISFGAGVFNDLLVLNSQIFSYFDLLLRFQKNSPSNFQDKIHGCSLSEDEIKLGLQNKIISQSYIEKSPIAHHFLSIGNEILTAATKMDVVIERLYSFNYFLSAQEVQLIRDMHEKIHRYVPYIESNIDRAEALPVNPTLAFMIGTLLPLQIDYSKFRKLIFKKNLMDRDYVISKIQRLFHCGYYKECIAECKKWILIAPFDSSLHASYLVRCYVLTNQSNRAYELLKKLLEDGIDLISYRNSLHPLLSDTVALEMITKKFGHEGVSQMRQLVENEDAQFKHHLATSAQIKRRFSS